MKNKITIFLILGFICSGSLFSQIQYSNFTSSSNSIMQNLSGPRVGITILTNGDLTETLSEEYGVNSNLITQFGYQFEKQITGNDQVVGLVEGILFIGGLERGLFLPSFSGMFGARFASGYEWAVGPNISLSGPSLVLAFGRTIQAGNINIPISLAWVPSTKRQRDINEDGFQSTETYNTGNRITFTVGFNFRTR